MPGARWLEPSPGGTRPPGLFAARIHYGTLTDNTHQGRSPTA